MATMEEKILGGPRENYCSSSEESAGEQSDSENCGTDKKCAGPASKRGGKSTNTGPKGVVEDWRNFKKLQAEQRSEGEKELRDLAKRLSKTCRTVAEDEAADKEKSKDEVELEEDEFLKAYTQRRIQEMMATMNQTHKPRFGVVFELTDAESYLKAADADSLQSTVLVHLYEPNVPSCQTMSGCLSCIAKEYPGVKICRIRASLLGTSRKFLSEALPALQAYRNGNLIGNFVRLTDEFGQDFYADDVESFLKEYGVLSDVTAADSTGKSVPDEDSD